MNRERILTGHRPTGPRHLGHLVGTLQTWIALQEHDECFFLIADLHVLTTDYAHPQRIQANVLEVVADWMAAGIDPQRSTLILQSAVPEHAQLALALGMLVSTARLERVPTFKDQVRELALQPSLGLMTYPVLQAADILLYKATRVPVGEDQLPHLELAREPHRASALLATPSRPQALLSRVPLCGLDNRAMHPPTATRCCSKVARRRRARSWACTDPARVHASDAGHVEGNPVFTYPTFPADQAEVEDLERRYRAGTIGDVEVKQRLARALNTTLEPLRERRRELMLHPQRLREALLDGTRAARPLAAQTLAEVFERMGLSPRAVAGDPSHALALGRRCLLLNSAPTYWMQSQGQFKNCPCEDLRVANRANHGPDILSVPQFNKGCPPDRCRPARTGPRVAPCCDPVGLEPRLQECRTMTHPAGWPDRLLTGGAFGHLPQELGLIRDHPNDA
jgi:tryptophanyl-tRNA synthetase